MAEFILKEMVKSRGLDESFHIDSAAVSSEELGNPIYPPAKRSLSSHGIPFDSSKTARRMEKSDYDRYDMIICMDRNNLRWLSRIVGDDPKGKVSLMMSFCGSDCDVADPWYTGDFERTYQDILQGCAGLLNGLALPDAY